MPPFLPPQFTVLVLERRGGEDSWWGLPKSLGGKPSTMLFTIPASLSTEVTMFITMDELTRFVDEINQIYLDCFTPTCPLLLLNLVLPLSSVFIASMNNRAMNRRIKAAVSQWNKGFEKRGIWFEHLRRRVGDKHYRSYICFCKSPRARHATFTSQTPLAGTSEKAKLASIASTASLSDVAASLPLTPPKPIASSSSRSPLRQSQLVVPTNEADAVGLL